MDNGSLTGVWDHSSSYCSFFAIPQTFFVLLLFVGSAPQGLVLVFVQ
jgi:hypothetical protein